MSIPRETQTDLYAKGEAPLALRTSERLRKGVDFIGRCAAWLLVPLVLITVVDVVARKLTWHGADGVQGV
jgi:TRAP-type mannitol/chloroaromatic compound transport system permease small subunit